MTVALSDVVLVLLSLLLRHQHPFVPSCHLPLLLEVMTVRLKLLGFF